MPAQKKRALPDDETDFCSLLVSGSAALGLFLDQLAVERLARYHGELKHWSRKINLIAKETSERRIIENHFLDSLLLLTQLGQHVHLLDVGSGAGLPGLVCKAARPEISLTLVEPRLKRVSFLKHVIRVLQLENVSVLACRIEDERLLPSSESYTHITSRAVADIASFLPMVTRFVKADTEIVCMKGPKWRQELEAAKHAIWDGNLEVIRTNRYELPFSGAERCLLVLKALAKSA